MTDSSNQPMSRRAARELERRRAAQGDPSAQIPSASWGAPSVASAEWSASSDPSPSAAAASSPGVSAPTSATFFDEPASAVYAPDGRLLTRREVRAMREALEAGELPPLVEPDDAPTRPRSSITPPVPLPDAPTASAAPALPPEAAAATSVPVERPSAGESAAPANESSTTAAAASAPRVSAPAAPALGTWGRRGRRSAVSARSAQSVASAPAAAPVQSAPVQSAPTQTAASAPESTTPASVPTVTGFDRASVSSAPPATPLVSSAPIVSSTPISSSPRPEPSNTSPAAPIVTSTPFTHATDAADTAPGAEERASRYAEFDSLLAPDGGGSTISTNALVLPSVPGHEDLPRALDGTGEIIVTGTFALPNSLAETGAHHPVLDGMEVDRLIDSDDPQPVAPGSGPVRASRAVSTHTATRGIIQPKRPKSNRLLTALAITASGLAVGVVGLLVVGVLNGVFF